jgi:phosphatidylglycerophosphatase A
MNERIESREAAGHSGGEGVPPKGKKGADPAHPEERRRALRTWYGLVATFGGLGLSPWAPGTVGSFGAFLVLLAFGAAGFGGVPWQLILVAVLAGTAAAHRYSTRLGAEDPGEIVIDEVAGYWVSVWGLPPEYAIPAFFLFRIVDIIKPWPISASERLPGGIGIMADDLLGGAAVNLILRAVGWLFLAGGFARLFG